MTAGAPVRLHRVVSGRPEAPTLVLGGSLGSDLSMWDPQVGPLEASLRLVRCDLRGHGGSPVPPGPYRIADLGADLLALLDDLGVERAHLGGLSLGAMVALWVAQHAPERVDRLVLLCTSARMGPPGLYAERARTVRAHGTASVADAVVGRWFTRAYADAHPATLDRMRAMVAATPAEGYAACCEALDALDLVSDLGRVRAPTLVVAGADDPATPAAEHGARIAEGVPEGRLVVLTDAAHLANVEQAAAVSALILEHLAATPR